MNDALAVVVKLDPMRPRFHVSQDAASAWQDALMGRQTRSRIGTPEDRWCVPQSIGYRVEFGALGGLYVRGQICRAVAPVAP